MRKLLIFSFCLLVGGTVSAQIPELYGFFHELSNRPRLVPPVIGPMINLQLLDFLIKQPRVEHPRSKKEVYDLGVLSLYNRKEWSAWVRPYQLGWYDMWENLHDQAQKAKVAKHKPGYRSKFAKHQSLINYLDQAVVDAPVIPYVFDAKNRSVAALHAVRFLKSPNILERRSVPQGEVDSVPFAFLDYAVTEAHMVTKPKSGLSYLGRWLRLGLDFHGATIPLFQDKDEIYRIYYREKVKGDWKGRSEVLDQNIQQALRQVPPEEGMWYRIADILGKSQPKLFDRLVERLHQRLHLTKQEAKEVILWRPKLKLRGNQIRELEFLQVAGLAYKGGYKKGKRTYVPCKYGLYKLMLLYLGLNNENEPTKYGDQERKVSQDLQELVRDSGWTHPWKKAFFSKDKFLNYEIAEILKSDPALFRRVQQTIDFSLEPLQEFNKFVYKANYYRANGKPFIQQEVDKFLPGLEQAVAMMLIEAVHYLWINACWYKRAQAVGMGFAFKFGTRLWQVGWLMHLQSFVNKAHESRSIYPKRVGRWYRFNYKYWFPEKASFIDVWGQVVNALQSRWREKGTGRSNWIAFDGHAGFVMSFDHTLQAMQRDSPVADKKLLDELKFAGVDHYYAVPLFTEEMVQYYKKFPFVG